jgi:hypothetical protein
MCDYRRGFWLVNGFISHLYTRIELQVFTTPSLISTLYRSLLHTHRCSQFVTVFTSCFLVTASNSGNSSASALTPLSAGHRLTTELSSESRVRKRVTLRLAVYRQSVLLGDKPLETNDQYFFNWTLAVPLWREDGSVVYSCCWLSPA